MARQAKARYSVEAKDDTDRGLRSAEGRLRAFKRVIEVGLGNALSNVGSLLAKWGTELASSADRLDDLAKRAKDLGASLEEQQAIDLFADLQGSTPQQVNNSIERLQTAVGELAKGTKSAKEDFEALGLTLEDFAGISGLTGLLRVGQALEAAGPQTTAIRRRLLGRGTGRLFAGDFVGAAQRAGAIGLDRNLSEITGRAERVQDAQAEIVAVIKRGFDEATFGGEFGLVFTNAVEILRDAVVSASQLGDDPTRAGGETIGQRQLRRELELIRQNQERALETPRAATFVD